MLRIQHLAAIAVVSVLLMLTAVMIQALGATAWSGEDVAAMTHHPISAPDFPKGLDWLNVSQPISLDRLRGKVVLLDFWTYCCINCMHIIPDLRRLEQKYADELVVIGVHSGKFDAERDTHNIRAAIQRYEIQHPVVNDSDMTIWRSYAVRAWPTLVLIDPTGRIVFRHSGEGAYDALDATIGQLIERAHGAGLIDRSPAVQMPRIDSRTDSFLLFPGKVLFDAAADRLFVADSNHNRVVIATADGRITQTIGSGQRGLRDGTFDRARFNHPQGMALDAQTLYVADTENHAIRRLDLAARTVTTVLGTGRQATTFSRPGAGTTLALNSPWDITLHEGNLYIAMAGSHQIWRANTRNWYAEPHAGTGAEALTDGPLRRAALAQPSAITNDGKRLYFADSEASAIRAADLAPRGEVSTIVGAGLFEFGDRDGATRQAGMQHPLGLALHGGYAYVADTYNNKIKRIDLRNDRVVTVFGTGRAGARDGHNATFDEPAGLAAGNDKLYIADTNNHAIRIADLRRGTVSTLPLWGAAPQTASNQNARPHQLPAIRVNPAASILRLHIALPAERKLNTEAPSQITVRTQGEAVSLNDDPRKILLSALPAETPVKLKPGNDVLHIDAQIYTCTDGSAGSCYFDDFRLKVPVEVTPQAQGRALNVRWDL